MRWRFGSRAALTRDTARLRAAAQPAIILGQQPAAVKEDEGGLLSWVVGTARPEAEVGSNCPVAALVELGQGAVDGEGVSGR
eukprot:4151823-Prymnesium_polylepis.3